MRKHGGGVLCVSVTQARKLRRKMSPPEVVLWQILRMRPNGLKFRRQRPTDPYIFDFYCRAAMLAIEIDGLRTIMGTIPNATRVGINGPPRKGSRQFGSRLRTSGTISKEQLLTFLSNVTEEPLHRTPCGPPPQQPLGRIRP